MNNSYIVAHKENKIYGVLGLEVNRSSFDLLIKDIHEINVKDFNCYDFITSLSKIFHYYLLDNFRPYNKYQIKLLEDIIEDSLAKYITSYKSFISFIDKEFDDIVFSYKEKRKYSLVGIQEEYSFATSVEFIKNAIKFIRTYNDYIISLVWR